MNKVVKIFVFGFGFMITFIMALIYSTFSWGLVLFKFWDWFVEPVFPFLGNINFYQAIGLTLVIGLFGNKKMSTETQTKTKEENSYILLIFILTPLVTLLSGYIINMVING